MSCQLGGFRPFTTPANSPTLRATFQPNSYEHGEWQVQTTTNGDERTTNVSWWCRGAAEPGFERPSAATSCGLRHRRAPELERRRRKRWRRGLAVKVTKEIAVVVKQRRHVELVPPRLGVVPPFLPTQATCSRRRGLAAPALASTGSDRKGASRTPPGATWRGGTGGGGLVPQTGTACAWAEGGHREAPRRDGRRPRQPGGGEELSLSAARGEPTGRSRGPAAPPTGS